MMHSGYSISRTVRYMKSRVLRTCAQHVKNGSSLGMVFRYSNVPKGACNMLSMQLADAGLRHAGAAEWFGPDIALKPRHPSAAFEKQRPDRWKMNQTETFCVRICLLRLRNKFEASRNSCSCQKVAVVLLLRGYSLITAMACGEGSDPETSNLTGRLTRGDKRCRCAVGEMAE